MRELLEWSGYIILGMIMTWFSIELIIMVIKFFL